MKPTVRNVRGRAPSPRKGPSPGHQMPGQKPGHKPGQKPGAPLRRRHRPWLFGPATGLPYVFVPAEAPAPDAGAAPPDAGEPPPDAGEPPPDAGEPPPDAGAASPDAGAASLGSNVPADSGNTDDGESTTSEFDGAPATLRRGAKGNAVLELQRQLSTAGHDPGPVDGIFGALTEAAVRGFQRAQGLSADGVVGPLTWACLLGGTPPVTPPVTPPTSGTDWSRLGADQRMRHAMGVLVNRYHFPENGAAGTVGNLYAECQLIPNRIEGSSSRTPMRAESFSGTVTDFTAEQIMNRSKSRQVGPKLPGVGLAQWTSAQRRIGLFRHNFQGRVLGASILFDMDAQLDYLVHEMRTSYASVYAVVTRPTVTSNDASDEVVYRFEIPASVVDRPRNDPQVQAVFAERRSHSQRALRAFQAP